MQGRSMSEPSDPDSSSTKAEEGGQPPPKTNPYVEFESFGQLLANLESSERAFQAKASGRSKLTRGPKQIDA